MRAALFQSRTGTDSLLGARSLVEAAEAAKRAGADMLFTPEMSALLDRDRARAATSIVGEDEDVALAALRETAAKLGLWMHIGSLALKGERGLLVNRGFVLDGAGAIRARYDKMHLFDVDLASGERWRESETYAAGTRVVVAETPWGRLGLSICYDLRFPALYQALSAAGATILAVPAAFTVPTGRAHWEVLLRARAIETASFVIAAAQGGRHADGRETWGHSLVVDPWGEVLLDMGETTGVQVIEIDPTQVEAVRGRIPVLAHRRAIPAAEVAQ